MKIAYPIPLLRFLYKNKVSFLLFAFCFVLSAFQPVLSQRIEVHIIKDLSNNSTANKAWGAGGAIHFDQWIKKTTFSAHFDWAMYRKKDAPIHPNYQRLSGGISAFYSVNISKKLSLQCGAEINYTNLKYSYIYDYDIIYSQNDTLQGRAKTLQQTGNFIGIGPHIGLNYELSPRFSVKFNFIPTYLISVGSKSSAPTVAPEYSKGMWLFPLQLGITYKILNSEQ